MNNAITIYHNPQNLDTSQIKNTVIWLHGLGANGADFVPIVSELGLAPAVKFIFPHAPRLPITINGGYVMPAWYDILAMDALSRDVDRVQITKSAARIEQIIAMEMQSGILPKQMVLAGFSQGGVIAYEAALTLLRGGICLGAVLALSTYFVNAGGYQNEDFADKNLPLALYHGTYDSIVAPALAQNAQAALINLGFAPTLQLYPMAHQVCPEQISDIGALLNSVFA